MNRTRRTGALLGLTASMVVASTIPAWATFDATGTSVPAKVGTVDVLAPTQVAATVTCTSSTRDAALTWAASPTSRIDRYVVEATVAGQPQQFTVPAGSTRFDYSVPAALLPYPVPVQATVTAVTDYGWAERSATTTAVWTSC